MTDKPTRWAWAKIVGVFALAGPPLPALALLAVGIAGGGLKPESVGQVGAAILLFGFFAYILGVIPAFLTGVLAAALSPRITGTAGWLAACALLGALVSAVFIFLLASPPAGARAWSTGDLGGLTVFFAASGGGAGFVCALLALGFRRKRGSAVQPRSILAE